MSLEIEYEPVTMESQKETWQHFAHFINSQFKIETEIPAPAITTEQPAKADSGWSTDASMFAVPDEAESDDEADECTFKRLDKPTVFAKAAIAVLTCPTFVQAARKVGISVRQLNRWRQNEEFKELLEKTRKEIYSAATTAMKTQLTASGLSAARTLQAIAENPKAADHARVSAAAKLATLVLQVQEMDSLEARLLELERKGQPSESTGTFQTIKKD